MVLVIASAIIILFKTFSQEHARPIKYTTKQERRRSSDQSSKDNRNYILWTLNIILVNIYANKFSSESHERHLKIKWNVFLHDLAWKSHHMKPCSFFSFGRIFIGRTWFCLFNLFVKVVSLSACLTLIHMRSGNQVEKFSKFKIKLPESFHHL